MTNRRSLLFAALPAFALAACARTDAARPEPRRVDPDAVGIFQIVGRPAGAHILIDGAQQGQVPSRVQVSSDDPHEIRVELEGYKPHAVTQTLAKGEERTLRVSLDLRAGPRR